MGWQGLFREGYINREFSGVRKLFRFGGQGIWICGALFFGLPLHCWFVFPCLRVVPAVLKVCWCLSAKPCRRLPKSIFLLPPPVRLRAIRARFSLANEVKNLAHGHHRFHSARQEPQGGRSARPKRLPPNPLKDFATVAVEPLHGDAAAQHWINTHLPRTKRVMIFIRGFNNTFEDSVYRFAQIVHDSGPMLRRSSSHGPRAPVFSIIITTRKA